MFPLTSPFSEWQPAWGGLPSRNDDMARNDIKQKWHHCDARATPCLLRSRSHCLQWNLLPGVLPQLISHLGVSPARASPSPHLSHIWSPLSCPGWSGSPNVVVEWWKFSAGSHKVAHTGDLGGFWWMAVSGLEWPLKQMRSQPQCFEVWYTLHPGTLWVPLH